MLTKNTSYDVIVVGGGTSGMIASLSAAQCGASTLIVEEDSSLGGTMTDAEVNQIMTFHDAMGNQVVKGIPEELIQRLRQQGGSLGHVEDARTSLFARTPFDPEMLKYVAQEMCLEEGIDLLLRACFVDAILDHGKVTGIIVHTKSGMMNLKGKVIIDCTGDGDVIEKSGAPYEKAPKKDMQPITMVFRLGNVDIQTLVKYIRDYPDQFLPLGNHIKREDIENIEFHAQGLENFPPWRKAVERGVFPPGIEAEQAWFETSGSNINRKELYFIVTRVPDADGTDAWDLARAEVEARRQAIAIADFLIRNLPGCNEAHLVNTASKVGVRDTRRIIGQYVLTVEDITEGRRFPDCVAKSSCPINFHKGGKESERIWLQTDKRGSVAYDIPYGCLLPQKIEGILVAGRIISATHEASGSTRMMGSCMATGQAAGVAAAIAVKRNILPSQVEVSEVQQQITRLEKF